MLGHDPELKPYPYDPAKAKQLLAEAGFPNGFEATLDAPNGRYLNDKAVAEAIVGQLNKVGLNITLNMPEYPALVQKIVVFHNGRISVGSSPLGGASLQISLPIADGPLAVSTTV